jgi:hypothetical protein
MHSSLHNQDVHADRQSNHDIVPDDSETMFHDSILSWSDGDVWLSRVLELITTPISKSIDWTIMKGITAQNSYHRVCRLSPPNSRRISMTTTIWLHMTQNMYYLILRATDLLLNRIVSAQKLEHIKRQMAALSRAGEEIVIST